METEAPDNTQVEASNNMQTEAPEPPSLPITLSLSFHLWDGDSASAAGLFVIQVSDIYLKGNTLSEVRKFVAQASHAKQYATYSICLENGSILGDDYPFNDYIAAIEANNKNTANTRTLYFKKPGSTPKTLLEAPKLGEIDLTLSSNAKDLKLLSAPELKEHQSAFAARDFAAAAGTFNSSFELAAQFNERDWAIIARTNALLNGIAVETQKDTNGDTTVTGLSNARRQAVRFKQRMVSSELITGVTSNAVDMNLRIPNFFVNDQSYILVYETQTSLQASMAHSSFSELDIKAAVSGGAGGFSASASGGMAKSSSNSTAGSSLNNKSVMHISYNFPRVTLWLDEECLELTNQCAQDLQQVPSTLSAERFIALYGSFFTTRVQLGGRLYANTESSTVGGSSASERASALKISASASFSTAFASGSASMSSESSDKSSASSKSSSYANNLSWQAAGGDTLLANNPAAWCPTVAPYYNWRITQQDQVVSIVELLKDLTTLTPEASAAFQALSIPEVLPTNPSIGKDLNAPPPKIPVSQQFYLSVYVSEDRLGQFLTIKNKSNMSAGAAAEKMDGFRKSGGSGNEIMRCRDWVDANSVITTLRSPESEDRGQLFELQYMGGTKVDLAQYNTTYQLYNLKTNNYIYNYTLNDLAFPMGWPSKPARIQFIPADPGLAGANLIHYGDKVIMQVIEDSGRTTSYKNCPEAPEVVYGGAIGGSDLQWIAQDPNSDAMRNIA